VDTDRLTLVYLGDPNSIHTRRWAGWFAKEGHRVHLLVPEGLAVGDGLDPAIAVERFSPYGRGRGPSRGVVAARRSLRRRLRAIGPAVLHAHYLTTAGWHGWLAGSHPFVVTVWGTDVYRNAHGLGGRLQARLILGAADLVTADSEDLAAATIAVGARADRMRVVQFGVDTDRFAPDRDPGALRERLGLDGRRVVFSPRTIAPLYRQSTVVEALAGLAPDVVGLFSAQGNREGELDRLKGRAAALGLAGRVLIVEGIAHEEMPGFLALADVVVSVPESDATAVTLLEAMAVGRPIVASDLPSVRALVGALDPDALVPVGDVRATRAAIEEHLSWTPERRRDVGARARAIVRTIADQGTNMRVVEQLYRDLAGRSIR
jgi:glycosyltransferase involved in cell wall biosynthesis